MRDRPKSRARCLQGKSTLTSSRTQARPWRSNCCGAAPAPFAPRSSAWRSNTSIGCRMIRAGSGCCGGPCRGTKTTTLSSRPIVASAKLILARCGPHHRATDHGQTMLHEAVSRDHGVGVQLATILLDAGARLDVRDNLLKSTPLGWACRWGRVEMVKLFLARGADPVEADAEPWATPRAWAEKMNQTEIVDLLTSARPRPSA